MLKAGDIVDYKGSLFIIDFEENGFLKLDLITDRTKSIVFDNYNNFVDDLQLVVGTEGECLCDCQLVPVKSNLVFDKNVKRHGLV